MNCALDPKTMRQNPAAEEFAETGIYFDFTLIQFRKSSYPSSLLAVTVVVLLSAQIHKCTERTLPLCGVWKPADVPEKRKGEDYRVRWGEKKMKGEMKWFGECRHIHRNKVITILQKCHNETLNLLCSSFTSLFIILHYIICATGHELFAPRPVLHCIALIRSVRFEFFLRFSWLHLGFTMACWAQLYVYYYAKAISVLHTIVINNPANNNCHRKIW